MLLLVLLLLANCRRCCVLSNAQHGSAYHLEDTTRSLAGIRLLPPSDMQLLTLDSNLANTENDRVAFSWHRDTSFLLQSQQHDLNYVTGGACEWPQSHCLATEVCFQLLFHLFGVARAVIGQGNNLVP